MKGDFLIDDAPHNLIDGEYVPILFDRPHNHGFDNAAHGIARVQTWDDVERIIRRRIDFMKWKESLDGSNQA